MKKDMIIQAWVRYRPESLPPSQNEEKKEGSPGKKLRVLHKDKELGDVFGP